MSRGLSDDDRKRLRKELWESDTDEGRKLRAMREYSSKLKRNQRQEWAEAVTAVAVALSAGAVLILIIIAAVNYFAK